MGLDITAYSNMKPAGEYRTHGDEDGDGCEEQFEHVVAFAYDSFPRSVRGLVGMEKVDVVGQGFIGGECYEPTEKTVTHGFRAGSYGGYSGWREELAEIAGFSGSDYHPNGVADENAPFYELIWFADNEGTIGPDAARDLLADFKAFEAKAKAHYYRSGYPEAHADYDWQRYKDWMEACELAAEGGLICFH